MGWRLIFLMEASIRAVQLYRIPKSKIRIIIVQGQLISNSQKVTKPICKADADHGARENLVNNYQIE